ncbi:hypothetical protein [Microtetraspora malaysiensis]|uniref:PH domain-containing protein n=1 Tax=Microtetraspora malaysiensis TaxID=161358 RepID=A0ABW6SKM6_9ACTN
MIWDHAADYVSLALLITLAVTVTFSADESSTFRGRVWAVRSAWKWAAIDTATVVTAPDGATVVHMSRRATAIRMLRDVMDVTGGVDG